ncbi:DUF3540 domain-containing protein [Castellaniella sp.]|uniref:DUF3540 domain-containing protein n=1 Tax=Castellaniella sp. TaxID=1955812 RepID=UPI002AFE0BD6|nr:DUF3540 domain-containing protein [Castellaniella sp.]
MHSTTPLIQSLPAATDTSLLQARIIGIVGDTFLTDTPSCPGAQQAFSCLITPQVADLVLLSPAHAGQPAYVLAILQRTDPQQARLVLPGGTQLQADAAGLQLHAKNLSLGSQDTLSLRSGQLDITAVSAQTRITHWQGWFDTLQAHAVSIQYGAKTLSATLGRLISRSIESFRSVQGLDETRAGRSSTVVQDHHQLQAGHITARATGFVKIDGQKIDLG